jgi:hypothetical protein
MGVKIRVNRRLQLLATRLPHCAQGKGQRRSVMDFFLTESDIVSTRHRKVMKTSFSISIFLWRPAHSLENVSKCTDGGTRHPPPPRTEWYPPPLPATPPSPQGGGGAGGGVVLLRSHGTDTFARCVSISFLTHFIWKQHPAG